LRSPRVREAVGILAILGPTASRTAQLREELRRIQRIGRIKSDRSVDRRDDLATTNEMRGNYPGTLPPNDYRLARVASRAAVPQNPARCEWAFPANGAIRFDPTDPLNPYTLSLMPCPQTDSARGYEIGLP